MKTTRSNRLVDILDDNPTDWILDKLMKLKYRMNDAYRGGNKPSGGDTESRDVLITCDCLDIAKTSVCVSTIFAPAMRPVFSVTLSVLIPEPPLF